MDKKLIGVILGVFVLIVGGMFAFAYVSQQNATAPAPDKTEPTADQPNQDEPTGRFSYIERVDAKHFFEDGTHTFVGTLTMPTPCDLLEANATVAESAPEQVTINFTVVNNADMCAQAMTEQRFRVSMEASEEASFSANLEGRPIEFNWVEAEEGETPEDYEVFIKG